MSFRVTKAPRIHAEITVPGDKSISHRAAMLAALANGTCRISNFLEGEDCLATCTALEALGVRIERPAAGLVVVHGGGALHAPDRDLDCGNSGTSMRLLSGLLASRPFQSRLTGDASLSRRPMRRIIEPLAAMGADIRTEGERDCPPLVIRGGKLHGIEYRMPVASAQVKSAILLAGLFAEGRTTVIEPAACRDHTERMLRFFLVTLRSADGRIVLQGGQRLESRDFSVPGDISSAAFWMAAAAAQPGARLLIRDVGLNPTRTAVIDVLVRMGAVIQEVVAEEDGGEPRGVLDIRGERLQGTEIRGAEIPNLIDEIPALAVAGALAEGETIIRDAAELRVKESDRIATVAAGLRAMGVEVEEFDDGMRIIGGSPLRGARIASGGDHRIAMAFAIAGLHAKGETLITDTDCVATSYPGFEETLQTLIRGGGRPRRAAKVIGAMGRKAGKAGAA